MGVGTIGFLGSTYRALGYIELSSYRSTGTLSNDANAQQRSDSLR